VIDVSTTWAEVIFRVKWIVFVRWFCYNSGPLKLIGQFSHDGIGWKTCVNFVIRWQTVLFRATLTRRITLYKLLILLGSNHLQRGVIFDHKFHLNSLYKNLRQHRLYSFDKVSCNHVTHQLKCYSLDVSCIQQRLWVYHLCSLRLSSKNNLNTTTTQHDVCLVTYNDVSESTRLK